MKYYLELPAIPPGRDFARDTFWHRYRERFTRRLENKWSIKESAYQWYDREEKAARLSGQPFPPAPIFTQVARQLPQPWDGRNEKAGRVPRNGK